MQYSLRHRFRGALLGAVLGEMLGLHCRDRQVSQFPSVERFGKDKPTEPLNVEPAYVEQSNILPNGLAEIAALGSPTEAATWLQGSFQSTSVAELAIATLPLALFYHDDWHQLQHYLEQTRALESTVTATGALVVGYVVALALREKLQPAILIDRLLVDLELSDRDPELTRQLRQVKRWVNQGAGVTIARSLTSEVSVDAVMDPTPISAALYGFLSTPTNFRVSLLRTAQLLHSPQTACTMVGALSGVYNSTAGLPLGWRKVFRSVFQSSSLCKAWYVSSEAELVQQADLLWAGWSGAYTPADWLQHPLSPVTASLQMIRPR